MKMDLTLSFREIVEREREGGGEGGGVTMEGTKPSVILERGYYARQIRNILEHFPRENLLVLVQERYNKDTAGENGKVFEFLGVDGEGFVGEVMHEHKRSYGSEMKSEDREWLAEVYEEENEKLFDLLGYRIDEWTKPQRSTDIKEGETT